MARWKSFEYIHHHLEEFFAKKNQQIYFHDFDQPGQKKLKNDINILLYGDVAKLLEEELPFLPQRFFIWVLCEKYSTYLQNHFHISKLQIGVIPRTLFLTKPSNYSRRIDSFVFAGRSLVKTKRLRLANYIVEEVRNLTGKPFTFHVCNAGKISPVEFHKKFSSPGVQGHFDLGPDWANYFPNSAFISLSHFENEDLGIAPCEALNFGLPCILSDWGGYSDFESNRIIKLPSLNRWSIQSEKSYAKVMAPKIVRFLKKIENAHQINGKKATPPSLSLPQVSYRSPFLAQMKISATSGPNNLHRLLTGDISNFRVMEPYMRTHTTISNRSLRENKI